MSDVGHQATPPDECETCGNPDEVLCDECALEEHLGGIERAERLREEDVFLYSIPLRTGTPLRQEVRSSSVRLEALSNKEYQL